MSLVDIIKTVLELGAAGLFIWGVANEEKLADFEQRLFSGIKSRFFANRTSSDSSMRFAVITNNNYDKTA